MANFVAVRAILSLRRDARSCRKYVYHFYVIVLSLTCYMGALHYATLHYFTLQYLLGQWRGAQWSQIVFETNLAPEFLLFRFLTYCIVHQVASGLHSLVQNQLTLYIPIDLSHFYLFSQLLISKIESLLLNQLDIHILFYQHPI